MEKSDGSVIDNGNSGGGMYKQKGFDIKVKNQAVENISGLYSSIQAGKELKLNVTQK
ncbi:hypothetical protein [Peribacillus sp. ACCC06369]|uniref:hypothetical protein n=1 Tax=Peribacillus sp. ACCC06369 TaxID=3055860 RepID=UPI0025A13912|nr:hypothetical protein [Peribacillus sp. ACCC06369]MDM5360635.1 hypothetical protein [Peribacillus sp. ACCC06369]